MWNTLFAQIKCWTQVQTNDLLPFIVREVSNTADELHAFINSKVTCIVHENVNSSEDLNSLFNQEFAVQSSCQVGIDVLSLNVWIGRFKMFLHFLQILLSCESIQYNVIVLFGQCISDTQAYPTQWSSNNGYFVRWSGIRKNLLWDQCFLNIVKSFHSSNDLFYNLNL